jgi:glycosyltransferase involved in cell wall biosynthesis
MVPERILITVVIPCYNAEETILVCLQSVIAQSFQNFEVLIIDDGSTDGTAKLVSAFIQSQHLGDKISLLSQSNAGPSAARNKGVKLAKGTWVAFLDADDVWSPDKLALQLKTVQENPDLALLGVRSSSTAGQNLPELSEISFKQLLSSNYFKTSGVLMKRKVALEVPFDEQMRYSEDYRVWLIVAYRYRVAILNKSLCSAITNKRVFGESGLSANLSEMQKGEISNYKFLSKANYITFRKSVQCISYSYLKYFRRIIVKRLSQFE